jgi:hypothetical protein
MYRYELLHYLVQSGPPHTVLKVDVSAILQKNIQNLHLIVGSCNLNKQSSYSQQTVLLAAPT